jgi:hypothetical protein
MTPHTPSTGITRTRNARTRSPRTRNARTDFLLACLLAVALCSAASAQGQPSVTAAPYESDILAARPVRTLLGLSLGGYAFQHLGSFSPNCTCSYEGETGARFHVGLELSRQYPKAGVAFLLALQYRDFSAIFTQGGTRIEIVQGGGEEEITYERTSDVKLRSLHVIPGIAWYLPTTPVYLSAGIDIGMPLRARYNNIERITSNHLFYDGSDTHTLFPESDIPGGTGLDLGLAIGLGMDIYLSDHVFLTPVIGATIPLSPVSSEDGSWRIMSEHAALLLKVRL